MEEIISAHIYYNEYMNKLSCEASRKMGVDYVGNATIIDLEGLSLSRHMNWKAMMIFKEMILLHTYYYPETCDVIYVVNYPPIFNYFWSCLLLVFYFIFSHSAVYDRFSEAEVEAYSASRHFTRLF